MTNIKAPNMKSTVLVAPRRARVLLWMILYFHLSVFVIICQYFFHDKYEEEEKQQGNLLGLVAPRRAGVPLWMSLFFSQYLSVFFFMTNTKTANMKKTGLMAPRRAGVPLWMSFFFSICQYFFL